MRNEQISADDNGDGARTVRLRIPAQPEYIALSRLALTGLSRVRQISDETLAELKLAITEACSNSVRHAYGEGEGMVDIVYRLESDRITIDVVDQGTGFDAAGAGGFRTSPTWPGPGAGSRSSARSPTSSRSVPASRVAARGSASSKRSRDSADGAREADRRLEPRPRGLRPGRRRGAAGPERRRRPRHRAARPRRPARRDVDRDRDHRRGSRGRARGGALDEETREGAPYRLRLVAHDPLAYDRYYNVVANPTLWFIQHRLWELASSRTSEPTSSRPGTRATRRVNAAFAAAVLDELEREPDAAVFFHDYHLYLAPRLVRERAPDALLMHFIHIPWPQPDYWRVLPRGHPRRRPRGPARERRRRLPHDALAPQLPPLVRDVLGADCDSTRVSSPTTAGGRSSPRSRSPSTRPSSTRSREQPAVLAAERRSWRAARAADPARRSHRPVEERRPRLPRLRAPARAPSRAARAGRHAGAARPVAPGHPAVRRLPRGDRARGARGERALRAATAGSRSTLRVEDDFARLDRRIQAVRRAARERRSSTG